MFSKIKRLCMVHNLGFFHMEKDHDIVLKYLKRPFAKKRRDEVLCNLFRLVALRKTNQEKWIEEYEFLVEEKSLDVFNLDEEKYISRYLVNELYGHHELNTKLNVENVSKRIRKLFSPNKTNPL